ncbi:MAG: hypothetical protein HYT97_08725 [Elusimicrobia bacterium]|nr:hypothetical protein [Elusimicrobiota bacterium]
MFSLYWSLPCAFLFLLAQSKSFLFFILSNPLSFNLNSVLQLFSHSIDIGSVLFLFLGFSFYGELCFKKRVQFENNLERFLFTSLIGEALVAVFILFFGILGFFSPWFFWTLFFFLLLGAFFKRQILIEAVSYFFKNIKRKVTLLEFLLFAILSAALLRGLIASGALPTDWDSLAYHLAFPKLFLEEGRFFRIPWAMNAHYPLNTEMIYTFILAMRGDLACHWLNFFHAILLLALIAYLVRVYFIHFLQNSSIKSSNSIRSTLESYSSSHFLAALLAVAIFSVQPVFQRDLGNASTDFPVAFACMLSFFAMIKAQTLEDRRISNSWLFLAGICSGIAMCIKLTGIWFVLSLLTYNLFCFRSSSSFLSYLFGTILFGFPWYLKNFIVTGNPIWPYLGEWFWASPIEIDAWQRMRLSVTEGVEKNFFNWITIPFQMIFKNKAFSYDSHYLLIPFLMILSLKFSLLRSFTRIEKSLLFIFILFSTFWFWSYQSWRYLLPLAGFIALLIAVWSEELFQLKKWKGIVGGILIFSFVPIAQLSINNEAFIFFNLKSKSFPHVSAKQRYLEFSLGAPYKLSEVANEILPKNAKVLFFRDVRGYYLNRSYAWGDPLNPGVFSYTELKNSFELYQKLKSLGFTHILYNPTIGNYKGDLSYYARSNQMMEEVLKNYCLPIFQYHGMGIFEINPEHSVAGGSGDGVERHLPFF